MRMPALWPLFALCPLLSLARVPNYDEANAGPYVLPDPLVFEDGRRATDPASWSERRREIVRLYEREMFGRTPPAPEAVVADLVEEGPTALGMGIRRQYRMWFRADRTGPSVDWLVLLPNFIAGVHPVVTNGSVVCENASPAPVVLFLNYDGNHTLLTDKEVLLPKGAWLRFTKDYAPQESDRGSQCRTDAESPFPVETILARGYAVMSACYGQVSPDAEHLLDGVSEAMAYTGVFDLWPKRDPKDDDNTTSIGAWAWALSRGLDLAERIPEIDARKSVVTGYSRLGKAALLAASRDERFAVCVPNQTGGGGCPLLKRDFGENVSTMTNSFPHWYCRTFDKYADNESAMPFDAHFLLASIAPRHLLVEGFNNPWFDTKGEFLACQAAGAAWTVCGVPGFAGNRFPGNADTSAIGQRLGYIRRGGEHGINALDWKWTLDFADQAFGWSAKKLIAVFGEG